MKRLVVAALLVAALAAAAWLWLRSGAAAPAIATLDRTETPAPASRSAAAPEQVAPASERASAQAPPAPALAPEAAPAPAPATPQPQHTPFSMRGLVLDHRGGPLARVPVGVAEGDPLAESVADGSFAARLQGDSTLLALGPAFTTLRGALVEARAAEAEHIVVAAPAVALEGVVQSADGRALADARVELVLAPDLLVDFPRPLDRATTFVPDRGWEATTSADGAFRIERAAAIDKASLRASAAGHKQRSVPVPGESRSDLVIVLEPDEPTQPLAIVVEGVVLTPERAPAPDATVRFGEAATKSDAAGRFRLALSDAVDAEPPLVAVLAGFQAAVVPHFQDEIGRSSQTPMQVTLVLGPPPLEIRGRVLDAAGKPCKDWAVAVLDGTDLVRYRIPAERAEQLTIAPGKPGLEASTAADGSFVVGGLLPRAYKLQVWDAPSLVLFISDPIGAGGPAVELRVPKDILVPRIAGRLVSKSGAPIANASVRLSLSTFKTDFGYQSTQGATSTTDAQGAFEFHDVPKQDVALDIVGEDILPARFDVATLEHPEDLRLVVDVRCHFRLDRKRPAEEAAKTAWLLDAAGEKQNLWQLQGGGWTRMQVTFLIEGRSPTMSAAQGSYTLVLMRDKSEIDRRPVDLLPGDVLVIEY